LLFELKIATFRRLTMEIAHPESLGFSTPRLARIRPYLQRWVDKGKFAGFQSLIARQGKVVNFENVGFANLDTAKPMADDTIFRIHSMTKPITTAAVMMLYEEGAFMLHDRLDTYLPEFKDVQVAESGPDGETRMVPPVRPVTIHDLLTHTGGLMSYGGGRTDKLFRERVEPLLNGRGKNALKEIVAAVASLPLRCQPGKKFMYGVSTDVLGYLVEVISGMPFADFMRQRIFEPLGMVDTAFWVPAEKLDRLATMYGPVKDNGIEVPGKLTDIDPLDASSYKAADRLQSGGGGLVSTTADYLRFCQMLLNRGELDGARLLGRKTVELMMMNHLPPGETILEEKACGFGLGGSVLLDPTLKDSYGPTGSSVGTWCWGGASSTGFWIDFKEELIGLLMLQYQPMQTYPKQYFSSLVYQAMI
jgi:CubicO group peptidase (beta-lactamase class C family)